MSHMCVMDDCTTYLAARGAMVRQGSILESYLVPLPDELKGGGGQKHCRAQLGGEVQFLSGGTLITGREEGGREDVG